MAIKVNRWEPKHLKGNKGMAAAINNALQKQYANIPSFLLSLMNRSKIPMRWAGHDVTLSGEQKFAVQLADALRQATLDGSLKCIWSHPANEGARTPLTSIILLGSGMIPGAFDYWFIGLTGGFIIELKFGDNPMSQEQDNFSKWAYMNGVPCQTVRAFNEAAIPACIKKVFDLLQAVNLYQPLNNGEISL